MFIDDAADMEGWNDVHFNEHGEMTLLKFLSWFPVAPCNYFSQLIELILLYYV